MRSCSKSMAEAVVSHSSLAGADCQGPAHAYDILQAPGGLCHPPCASLHPTHRDQTPWSHCCRMLTMFRFSATRQLARLRSPLTLPHSSILQQQQQRLYAATMPKYPEFQGESQCDHMSDCSSLTELADVMGCQAALFEWADSYDAKDWARLRECVAPSLMVSLAVHRMVSMGMESRLIWPGRLPGVPQQEVG